MNAISMALDAEEDLLYNMILGKKESTHLNRHNY